MVRMNEGAILVKFLIYMIICRADPWHFQQGFWLCRGWQSRACVMRSVLIPPDHVDSHDHPGKASARSS